MSNINIIDENECIGDSLDSINANFEVLSTIVDALTGLNTTNFNTLSTSFELLKLALNPSLPITEPDIFE